MAGKAGCDFHSGSGKLQYILEKYLIVSLGISSKTFMEARSDTCAFVTNTLSWGAAPGGWRSPGAAALHVCVLLLSCHQLFLFPGKRGIPSTPGISEGTPQAVPWNHGARLFSRHWCSLSLAVPAQLLEFEEMDSWIWEWRRALRQQLFLAELPRKPQAQAVCTKHFIKTFHGCSVLRDCISRESAASRGWFGLIFFFLIKCLKLQALIYFLQHPWICCSCPKILMHLKENLAMISFLSKFWRRFVL